MILWTDIFVSSVFDKSYKYSILLNNIRPINRLKSPGFAVSCFILPCYWLTKNCDISHKWNNWQNKRFHKQNISVLWLKRHKNVGTMQQALAAFFGSYCICFPSENLPPDLVLPGHFCPPVHCGYEWQSTHKGSIVPIRFSWLERTGHRSAENQSSWFSILSLAAKLENRRSPLQLMFLRLQKDCEQFTESQ